MGSMKLGSQAKKKVKCNLQDDGRGTQGGSGPGGKVKRLQERVLQVNEINGILKDIFQQLERRDSQFGKVLTYGK